MKTPATSPTTAIVLILKPPALLPLILAAVLTLTIIVLLLGAPYWRARRRQRIRAQAFPRLWRQILQRRMPYFQSLPAGLQLQLKQHIQVFLAEKRFVGCGGLTITDEIRITIAAHACLLLLNRTTDYYPRLHQILVYPDAFIVPQRQADGLGLVSEHQQVLSGESWQQGQLILSWRDTALGAQDPHDGCNVALHEFAHQLDQETGSANGAPALSLGHDYQSWSSVLGAAFAELQTRAHSNQPSLFDHYGATNPAEFFAVATEVFFEQPQALADDNPALYQQLSRYYRIDPLSW